MAGKTKNILQRRTFLEGEGQWSERHGYDLAVNLGAKFSEASFLHFKTQFYANQPMLSKTRLIPIILPVTAL